MTAKDVIDELNYNEASDNVIIIKIQYYNSFSRYLLPIAKGAIVGSFPRRTEQNTIYCHPDCSLLNEYQVTGIFITKDKNAIDKVLHSMFTEEDEKLCTGIVLGESLNSLFGENEKVSDSTKDVMNKYGLV